MLHVLLVHRLPCQCTASLIENFLKLNTPRKLKPFTVSDGVLIKPPVFRNPGVWCAVWPITSFSSNPLTKSVFFHLSNIVRLCLFVINNDEFLTSRTDHYGSIPAGLHARCWVTRSSAGGFSPTPSAQLTSFLRLSRLRRLPLDSWVTFKILIFSFRSQQDHALCISVSSDPLLPLSPSQVFWQ